MILPEIIGYNIFEFLSCEGVQQGDPLGPFLFCLATLPLVKEIMILARKNESNGVATFFMDDGTVIAPHKLMEEIIRHIISQGPKYGLHL